MRTRYIIQAIAGVVVLAAAGLALTSNPASASRPFAKATLVNAAGVTFGDVTFTTELKSDKTIVKVKLSGLSGTDVDAYHGFHIHANDNPANGDGCIADATQPASTWFVSADGHWKSDPGEIHGKHAGDLPSIFTNNDGTSTMRATVSRLTPSQIIGRVVIFHAGADNFGNVPVGPAANQYTPGPEAVAATQATGNAGVRAGCGVITSR